MSDYIKATNFTSKDTLPTGNANKIVKGAELDTEFTAIASAIASKTDSYSPTLTGVPTAPTAAVGTATTQIATTAFVSNSPTIATPTITGGTITGITDLAVADGGTGVSTIAANAVVLGNGTSAIQTVAPGASGNSLVSNGTTWTSAPPPVRGSGVDTILLSTSTPSSTLTATNKQFIRVALDTTIPVNPSLVMPDMTTLTVGEGYFVISNETGLPLAIKDSSGTIREYLGDGKSRLNITSISTATGFWYFSTAPSLGATSAYQYTVIPRSSYMTSTTASLVNLGYYKLDNTNFVFVFTEGSSLYAKLYTVNTSTGAFTAGNKLTLLAGTPNGYNIAYDTDNAGHALLVWVRDTGGNSNIESVGLSVSGGTLYASSINTLTIGTGGPSRSAGGVWCAYLGSSSAYMYGAVTWADCVTPSAVVRGGTVTGTTTVTYTQSANNTNYNPETTDYKVGRTSLTTFVAIGLGGVTNARYINCTPASNTFTIATRASTATPLQIEVDCTDPRKVSIAQAGWSYCSGKVQQDGYVYDITQAGTSSVTCAYSSSVNIKNAINTNYQAVTPDTRVIGGGSQSLIVSSSQMLIYNGGLVQSDPSSSTFNFRISFCGLGTALLLSSSYGVAFATSGQGTTTGLTFKALVVPIATPIA